MLIILVLMLVGETLWRLCLLIANLQKLQPRLLAELGIGGSSLRRVSHYQMALGQWQLFGLLYQRFLFVGLLLSGFFFWYDNLLSTLQLPLSLHGVLFLLTMEVGGAFLNFPLYLYRQLLIEEKFGFNKASLTSIMKDKLIASLVLLLLFVPLFWLLLQVMTVSRYWWVYGFVGMMLVQLILFWLYPLLIAPLFNRFTPLAEGPLRDRLQNLLKAANFPCKGLFVMDGSRRSAHSNAYFTGMGNSRRIVLYDTLIEQLNEEELAAVLAHEIGHYRHRHIQVNLLIMMLGMLLLFLLGAWALGQDWLFRAVGFSAAKPHLLILLAGWLLPLEQYLIQPLVLWLSRHHEYQADAFSAKLMASPEPLSSALRNLAKHNYSHPAPHLLYVLFHYSHPPLRQRLAALSTAGVKLEKLGLTD